MAEYQNIFTRVQVKGPGHMGVPLPRGSWARTGKPFHSYLLGLFGDAQIGHPDVRLPVDTRVQQHVLGLEILVQQLPCVNRRERVEDLVDQR